MNYVRSSPTSQFLKGLSEKIEDLLTDRLDFSGRREDIHKTRNGVEGQAKTPFAGSQRIFGAGRAT